MRTLSALIFWKQRVKSVGTLLLSCGHRAGSLAFRASFCANHHYTELLEPAAAYKPSITASSRSPGCEAHVTPAIGWSFDAAGLERTGEDAGDVQLGLHLKHDGEAEVAGANHLLSWKLP